MQEEKREEEQPIIEDPAEANICDGCA